MMSYLCQKCRNIGDQQDLFSDKACEKTTLILKIGARYTAWLQSLISVSSDGDVTSFVTSLSSEDSRVTESQEYLAGICIFHHVV